MVPDTGFFRRSVENAITLCPEFLCTLMALMDGQDVQEGKDSTLVSPGHPEAAFEAIFGVV